jgi:hypothetical protein
MAANHHHDHHDQQGGSDLTVGLTGLGIGLVFIFIVAAFSHWLALS